MKHLCHAKECKVRIDSPNLMCSKHWFMVPPDLRHKVWAAYQSGQSDDKKPSKEWCAAAEAAINHVWKKENGKKFLK